MREAKAIVAMGGRSLEREISLRSGHRVERALRTLGYAVQALDVDGGFIDRVLAERPHFVFVAMHGRGGRGRHAAGPAGDAGGALHGL